jgi:flagellar export protein FliJ
MKRFRFTLQRVLDWQRERCDLIENRIKKLCGELESIQARIAASKAALIAAEQQVLHARQIEGTFLISLTSYKLRQLKTEAALNVERQGCQRRLAEERAAWIEARKRYRILERLKHRKHLEYSYEFDRELEHVAAEAYAARWHAEHGLSKSREVTSRSAQTVPAERPQGARRGERSSPQQAKSADVSGPSTSSGAPA